MTTPHCISLTTHQLDTLRALVGLSVQGARLKPPKLRFTAGEIDDRVMLQRQDTTRIGWTQRCLVALRRRGLVQGGPDYGSTVWAVTTEGVKRAGVNL